MSRLPPATCMHCGAPLAEGHSVCPDCSLLDDSSTRDYASVETQAAGIGSSLAEGTTFDGRYVIVAAVGIGGMGEVYRAHDTVLNRTVAKVDSIGLVFHARSKISTDVAVSGLSGQTSRGLAGHGAS